MNEKKNLFYDGLFEMISPDGDSIVFVEGDKKYLRSKTCNYDFNKKTGYMEMWGETVEDDIEFSPFGPFIADIEVTTICRGPSGKICPFCYKSNNSNGYNMPLSTFKEIIDKMPICLTQVALGADAQCESNPEIWDMMKYVRSKGIVPNITVADITDETADKLVEHCGAVAVSRYADKNICYDSIKKLTDRGMKQTNMHFMIHSNNFDDVLETLDDIKNDERLSKLNAVVFLSLKQKGRGVSYTPLSQENFTKLVETCMHKGIPFGFDSCSGYKFVDAVKNMPNSRSLIEMCEPCDSTIQSIYFSAKGDYYPCSFCEDNFEPINISEVGSVFELWQRQEVIDFRFRLLNNTDKNGVRCCPMFNV